MQISWRYAQHVCDAIQINPKSAPRLGLGAVVVFVDVVKKGQNGLGLVKV